MMTPIPQDLAVDPDGLGPIDRAHFWRVARHAGLECLTAEFRSHRYPPHTHDGYVVGVITAGCEAFTIAGVKGYAGVGEFCLVNPGEVHDGEPWAGGYRYRMSYPSVELVAGVAAELSGRDDAAPPHFPVPIVADAEAAGLFAAAHRALERGGMALEADIALIRAYALLLSRHARERAPALAAAPRAVARAMDYLDAHFADDTDLPTLAGIAGLSRFHLIRAFRQATGLTPHAWRTDRRVNAARRLLAQDESPAEVAAAVGFCDQAHLTRAFKARVGVAPGAYRAA